MDELPHIFCARCKGIILGDMKTRMIAGKNYHNYCAGKVFEDQLMEDKRILDEKIKKIDSMYKFWK